MYKQFIAGSCNGCSVAPLTNDIHNPIYQELIDKSDYFGDKIDKRTYLDIRASSGYTNKMKNVEKNDSKITLYIRLNEAAPRKLRLRI